MRIGVLGSGLMGAKLGTLFARAGHDVVFSYARRAEKLNELARAAGPRARAGAPREAAENADALLIAVHWSNIDDVLTQAGDLAGKVTLTCSLPMNAANTELLLGRTTSAAEALAKKAAKARVVCAFNTVPSEVLFGVFEARHKTPRPSLVYCGDDAGAKRIAAELISDVGFAPVDAGPLRIARYTEPFALLVGELAYEGDRGPEVAYRFEWGERLSALMPELAAWDNFFVVIGSAAGALIGLQFVVMTLIAQTPAALSADAGAAFGTPTTSHFGAALLMSALLLAPWRGLVVPAALCVVVGVCGVAYAAIIARRVLRQTSYRPGFEDWLFHFALPLAAYLALAASGIAVAVDRRDALFGVGAAALLLMFVGIHNAWDNIAYHVFVNMQRRQASRGDDVSRKEEP